MKRSALLGATAALALAVAVAPAKSARAAEAEAATAGEDAAEPVIVELPAEGPAATGEPAELRLPEKQVSERTEPASEQAVAEVEARQQATPPAVPVPAAVPAQASAQAQAQQAGAASAEVPVVPDIPGVLTRKGALVVEPGIEYSHTNVNQFSFGGVAILDTVLVGAIEAKQANRDAVTGTLGLRLGVTDRLEGEVRIPYMYRDDTSTNTFVNSANTSQSVSLTDSGLGDIEGAVHYQFNDGTGKWPVFVGNLRAKSTTGTSPYDVKRNNLGVEEELATGSGFWGIEPSVTVIAPSDPAVFYGNIGYLWNMKSDINKQIGSRYVDKVDPGDAIRLGVGMGLALNEKVSFSVGYQHDWIMKTKTTFADGAVSSPSLSVGSLTLGVNWQMTDSTALNVSVAVGVTDDAPDVRLMARVPITLDLF